jgi:putative tricarboxylic transport membrane protein
MQRNRDITIGVIMLAFSAVVFAMTQQLPKQWDGGGLTPATFPSALAGFIGFLSITLIVSGITSKDREKLGPFFGPFFWQMVIFFAVMAAYIFIMPLIGYITSTVIFVIATYLLLVGKINAKSIIIGIIFAVISAVAVYAMFGLLLKVPVIQGPIDFAVRGIITAITGGN